MPDRSPREAVMQFRSDRRPGSAPGPEAADGRWPVWTGTVVPIVLVVVAAVLSIAWRLRVPVEINLSGHDGYLFARQAESIESGDWLGAYDNLILAKGPGYPLAMAFAHAMGLELKLLEHLVYLLAAAAVALALLLTTRRRWVATAAFLVLAFNPANYGRTSASVMRENLFGSLGVLAIALTFLTALAVVRRGRWWWVALAAVGSGAAVGLYWLTREEGVAILPPLACVAGGVALISWWSGRRASASGATVRRGRAALWGRAGVAVVLTVGAAAAPLAIVRSLNSDHYGIALGNDMSEGSFLRAYADWSRVQAGDPRDQVPITEAQRQAVYAVSPAARELRPDLEVPENKWRFFGCDTGDCEFGGGWMVWALRDAAGAAGHYEDAGSAQRFFARLSEEIDGACTTGELSCAPRLPATLQPLQRAPLDGLARSFLQLSGDLLIGDGVYALPDEAVTASPEVWEQYRAVVHGVPAGDADAAARQEEFGRSAGPYGLLAVGYRIGFPLLLLGAAAGVVAGTVRAVRRRGEVSLLLPLAVALVGAVLIRLGLLALVHTAEYDASAPRYQLPAQFLLVVLAVVGLALALPDRGAGAVAAPAAGEPAGRPEVAADEEDAAAVVACGGASLPPVPDARLHT